jgi:3-oxoacyl-[acyl-carrier protein] reductase
MALGLARAGARVALVDVKNVEASRGAVARASKNDAVAAFTADVAQYAEVASVVANARARFGTVDIVVNNAGIGAASIRPDFITRPIRFWEIEPAAWTRILAVNANGPFYFAHAAAAAMVERGWGRFVNVTTTYQTMLSFEAYGPSKAALEAHSYIAARALAGTGVTVNVLIPGGPADTAQVTDDIGVPRSALLPPAIMIDPLVWLCSAAADDTSGLRFSAAEWDPTLPRHEALARAARPLAWPELVRPIIVPPESSLGARHAE